MDLITITMVTLWFVWMILCFIHTNRIIGIDGFSDKAFKAGKSKTLADNYNIEFDKIKLNIEIDGLHHLSIAETEHDEIRTGKLNQLGISVIRFYNDQINYEFPDVCNQIHAVINQRLNK